MTLTLRRMSAGLAIVFALLACIFLLGNQRLAHASLGADIVCRVFTDLNHVGEPIPVLSAGDCQNPPSAPPQCSDDIDNDGNGLKDFPADLGCSDSNDNNESGGTPTPPACSNNTDDDDDGFIDENDPNCHTDGDPTNSSSYGPSRSESGSLPACWNGIDDDSDGLKDFPADPGCSSPVDTDEQNSPPAAPENTLALCSDGVDNDADGTTDLADPDCAGFQARLVVVKIVINDDNGTNTVSDFSLHVATTSTGMAETIGVSSGATTTVSAGTWTVGEIQKAGYTATFGGDCNASGQVIVGAGETKTCTITNNDIAPGAMACADGIDNDGDGLIDSADPGCSGSSDNDETDAPPSSGGNGDSPPSSPGPVQSGGGNGGIIGLIGTASSSSVPAQVPAVLGVSKDAPPVASTESCDKYLTAFIKSAAKNDENQVRRLQYVLRDFEGVSGIELSGVYDAATLAAVHAFQTKYASEILKPWGIGKSTGFVYLTTRKKVNEIYCRDTKQFPLTLAEQQTIDQTRSSAPASTVTPSNQKVGAPKDTSVQSATTAPEEKKSLWEQVLGIFGGAWGP